MIKFGFEGYETEFPNWSKHHKVLSTHVKRVYEDGEIVESKDKEIKEILKTHEDKLKFKHVSLYNRKTDTRRNAVDYYLPLENLEYEEGNLKYYSSGASNTKQTTYMRFKFLIEDNLFILDSLYKTGGHCSTTFKNYIGGIDFLEDLLEDITDEGGKIEEVGIQKGEDGDYLIAVANECHYPDSFEISKRELLDSLIAAEVYRFDMEIVD